MAEPQSSAAQSRAHVSETFYQMAYFMLPQIVYSEVPRVIGYFSDEAVVNAGAFLYIMCCKAMSMEPLVEVITQFRQYKGTLSEGQRYYLIQYPPPSPDPVVELFGKAVLTPYFSAFIETKTTVAVQYFTLGQRPMVEPRSEL